MIKSNQISLVLKFIRQLEGYKLDGLKRKRNNLTDSWAAKICIRLQKSFATPTGYTSF